MSKALGGFLIGFFLATLLFFGFIFVKLGPIEPDVRMLLPQAETAYSITHSDLYTLASGALSTLSLVPGIGSGLSAISQIMTTATHSAIPSGNDTLNNNDFRRPLHAQPP